MKRIIWALAVVSFAGSGKVAIAAADKAECDKIKEKIEKAEKAREAAKPKGVGGLEGGTDTNAGDMGQGKGNAGKGAAASRACVNKMTPVNKDFKKLKDQAKEKECSDEEQRAEKGATQTDADIAACKAAEAANQGQEKKNGDNEKKMGDDKKKDDKGGGGGSPPQMPQIPPKKEEPKKQDDTAAKEAARQSKIAQCKVQVQMNLEVKKANCEKDHPFDPNHPVADQKKAQDECKQNAIFASQSEMNNCELMYPPVIPGQDSTISGSGTSATQTSTSTNTNTNTK